MVWKEGKEPDDCHYLILCEKLAINIFHLKQFAQNTVTQRIMMVIRLQGKVYYNMLHLKEKRKEVDHWLFALNKWTVFSLTYRA